MFVPSNIWPNSSPGLKFFDFWLNSMIGKQSNANFHLSVKSFKTAIRRAFRNLDDEEVKKTWSSFRQRISNIFEAEGDLLE